MIQVEKKSRYVGIFLQRLKRENGSRRTTSNFTNGHFPLLTVVVYGNWMEDEDEEEKKSL